MKKRLFAITMLAIFLLLSGCGHTHTWQAATCIAPKICPECGTTEGEAMGHNWIDATCTDAKVCGVCLQTMGQPLGHAWIDATCAAAKTCAHCGLTEGDLLEHTWNPATCEEPETCSICGSKQGEALGHKFSNWSVTKKATCSEAGVEACTCTVCGKVNEREIELVAHTPGQWTISVQATPESAGTKVKQCKKCNAIVDTESYTLTDNEIKQYYNKEYASISYDNLSRYPQDYEGEKVKFSGRVVQVCSEAKSALYYSTYRVATSGNYNNVVLIYVDNYGSGSRILEGDRITFYGKYDGLYTYTTVMGASVTIPSIKVDYVS